MINQSLSLRLHSETKDVHRVVEATGAMQRLLRGRMTGDEYRALLVNLRSVYRCLEAQLERASADPTLALFHFQKLKRAQALDMDLLSLGVETNQCPGLVPITSSYCAHVDSVATIDPRLLIAHAYVRYLGDLHGGQVLARLVTKIAGSTANNSAPATHFYDFGSGPEVESRISGFRAALDAVTSENGLHGAIVSEALSAFEFHRQLFTTLDQPRVP